MGHYTYFKYQKQKNSGNKKILRKGEDYLKKLRKKNIVIEYGKII